MNKLQYVTVQLPQVVMYFH